MYGTGTYGSGTYGNPGVALGVTEPTTVTWLHDGAAATAYTHHGAGTANYTHDGTSTAVRA